MAYILLGLLFEWFIQLLWSCGVGHVAHVLPVHYISFLDLLLPQFRPSSWLFHRTRFIWDFLSHSFFVWVWSSCYVELTADVIICIMDPTYLNMLIRQPHSNNVLASLTMVHVMRETKWLMGLSNRSLSIHFPDDSKQNKMSTWIAKPVLHRIN